MRTLKDAGLAGYPFKTVPPTSATSLWVDRQEFRHVLEQLANSWSIRKESSIHLLWADFGAGKTHALRFLQHLATMAEPPSVTVYCDLPKATSDFKSVYEQIVPQIPEDELCAAILDFRRDHGEMWLSTAELRGDRDTPRVLWMLSQMREQPQGEFARKWLRGERLTTRELATLDYVSAIRSSDHATRTLSTICRLMTTGNRRSRVVLMLDEFQRIGEAGEKRMKEVNAGIHTLFNSCPDGLAILLTYSFGEPENIKFLVSEEVLSRVSRVLNLPALEQSEGVDFANDLLAHSHLDGARVQPFSASAIRTVISQLSADSNGKLTPRRIMQGLGVVFDKVLAVGTDADFPISQEAATRLYEPPAADTFS